MYINFIEDRKALGYEVLRDTSCGIKLVLIVDSTVPRLLKPSKCKRQFIKKLPSKLNRKSKKVIVVITLVSTLWLSNVEATPAMGLSIPAAPVVRIQPSYRHSSEVKTAPTVRPIIINHMIPLIYINGHYSYINEQLLKKLRAGNLSANVTIVAIGVVIYVMCQLSGVDAFTIFDQIGKWNAPQPSPGFGLAPTPTSTQISVIPTKAQEFNDMSLKFNQPQSQYVMTKREALELIAKTYPGQMEVTANERITDWQASKHLYHAKGVGVDPEMYGITQEQLMEIGKPGGLTEYVRKGNKLPSIEHVKAYQEALKNICENSQKRTDSKYYYKHGVTSATVYYDEDNRVIVSFNQTSGDLITGDRQRENVFNRFMADNTLGGLQWIAKWRNN
uniref:Uncharacterized protein n=1 Tax=Cylindrotheca closterium TaxID=2856 RepID=A0A023JEH7_9STRA|nr:hypothetical protein [Cylindrotheca closterium]